MGILNELKGINTCSAVKEGKSENRVVVKVGLIVFMAARTAWKIRVPNFELGPFATSLSERDLHQYMLTSTQNAVPMRPLVFGDAPSLVSKNQKRVHENTIAVMKCLYLGTSQKGWGDASPTHASPWHPIHSYIYHEIMTSQVLTIPI